eukprot:11205812-Heterocapsa_arctica.AAC.1
MPKGELVAPVASSLSGGAKGHGMSPSLERCPAGLCAKAAVPGLMGPSAEPSQLEWLDARGDASPEDA